MEWGGKDLPDWGCPTAALLWPEHDVDAPQNLSASSRASQNDPGNVSESPKFRECSGKRDLRRAANILRSQFFHGNFIFVFSEARIFQIFENLYPGAELELGVSYYILTIFIIYW